MDFRDTPEQARFRAEVRDFIRRELPDGARISDETATGIGMGEDRADLDWHRKLAAKGWVGAAWPREYGGAGLGVMEQFIFGEEMARARAPRPNMLATGLAGPTIIVHGTEAQKAEHLPGILSGEVFWCQGFSEPGSGSDLASLQTTAVRDGDDFIVNGQKIWTSGAHRAQRMMLLARTDADVPKHRGLSFFLLDMRSPGITVRPLVNMAGIPSFNQVFFDNVRVPASDMLGELNRGWYVATTTLDFERSSVFSSVDMEMIVAELLDFALFELGTPFDGAQGRHSPTPLVLRPGASAIRYELTDRHIETQVGLALSYRVASMQARGLVPNAEASITKLYLSELGQRVSRTGMRLLGLYGLLDEGSKWAALSGRIGRLYLLSVGSTIAGGTSEVQRLIIATRGLGMPRSD